MELDARRARTVLRGVYDDTLSDAVCSAIPILSGQMSAL
jgi:hypothetical protein